MLDVAVDMIFLYAMYGEGVINIGGIIYSLCYENLVREHIGYDEEGRGSI